jgi:hypothetical protein
MLNKLETEKQNQPFLIENGYMLPMNYTTESKEFMLGLQDQIRYLTVYNQALIVALGQANTTFMALDFLIPQSTKEQVLTEQGISIQFEIDGAIKKIRRVYSDVIREHIKKSVRMVVEDSL